MKSIFVSWTKGNGRTEDLARALNLEPRYIHKPSRFGVIGRYIRQLILTKEILRSETPQVAFLMLPPFIAIYAFSPKKTKRIKFVVDLHTGFFSDPKWSWASRSALKAIKRRGGIAIVTNNYLQNICEEFGLDTFVLHDIIDQKGVVLEHENYLLCPVSYANDEPIEDLLSAASLTSDITWKFTGRAPKHIQEAAPANVEFTGFVSDEELERLLHSATGIVALTTRDHTMQRAGYEAFNFGNVQITSDFDELRDFYQDSAIYSSTSPDQIASSVETLITNRSALIEKTIKLREQRIAEQANVLDSVRSILEAD